MEAIKISPPWYTYWNMVNSLFEKDEEVTVGQIDKLEDGVTYGFTIEVRSHDKWAALKEILPEQKTFGKVALKIDIIDKDETHGKSVAGLFKKAFKDNPIVDEVLELEDHVHSKHTFVMFAPEVFQFYNDNMMDLNGNWTGIAEQMAKEVFEDFANIGVHFCTSKIEKEEYELYM